MHAHIVDNHLNMLQQKTLKEKLNLVDVQMMRMAIQELHKIDWEHQDNVREILTKAEDKINAFLKR